MGKSEVYPVPPGEVNFSSNGSQRGHVPHFSKRYVSPFSLFVKFGNWYCVPELNKIFHLGE
jgi:hypothetical protein